MNHHGKGSVEADVVDAGGVPVQEWVAPEDEDPHEQDAHLSPPPEETPDDDNLNTEQQTVDATPHEKEQTDEDVEEYQSRFPPETETPRAVTTYDVFSDPHRFSPESIANRTHLVSDDLGGTMWLDADGDGVRGSADDPALNALEYDTGIGGVKVYLAKCREDGRQVHSSTSLPNVGGAASSMLRSEVPEAGRYSFPLETIEEGRYYVVYQAPPDHRITGNVLPLERTGGDEYFECIPAGGEGDGYMDEIRSKGDLDWGGYCARSIGCLEVDKRFNLFDEFPHRVFADGGDGSEYEGTMLNLVAMPDGESFLNVGLAREAWPLLTAQMADAQISLSFPPGVGGEDLASAVPRDFGRSEVKRNLEAVLKDMLAGDGSGSFELQDVVLRGGEIQQATAEVVPQGGDGRGSDEDPGSRRMLRGLVHSKEAGVQSEPLASPPRKDAEPKNAKVTYTFATRGRYNPPPHEQLGTIISDSINADPMGLVKSLKNRKNNGLPELFENVTDAGARHLTMKVEKPKRQPGPIGNVVTFSEAGDDESQGSGLGWATIPVILLSTLIAALIGVLLFRRMFPRRVKADKRRHVEFYLNKGLTGFAVSSHHLEDQLVKSRNNLPMISEGPSASTESSDEDDNDRRRRERHRRRHDAVYSTRDMAHASSGTNGGRSVGTDGSGGSRSRTGGRASRGGGGGHGDRPRRQHRDRGGSHRPERGPDDSEGRRRRKKKKKRRDGGEGGHGARLMQKGSSPHRHRRID